MKKEVITLFVQFFKFGCFTFGGGWSIITQMQKVYVEEQKCITNEELLDLTSVGRSIPGVMIANIAMLFGYRQAGILGGIACVVGLTIPPMTILAIITMFYTMFRTNPFVNAAMTGIRVAVVPIILSAVTRMIKGSFQQRFTIFISILAFIAYLIWNVGCIWIVIGGACCGIGIKAIEKKRGHQT